MAFVAPLLFLNRHRPSALSSRHAPCRRSRRSRVTMMSQSQKETLETAWTSFAERMKTENEVPPEEEWQPLFDIALEAGDDAAKAIWLVNLMRDTGRRPTAITYDKVLQLCSAKGDQAAAFHLVERMFEDKVLLGDVELPDGMEDMLRAILPPEAFE